MRSLPQTFSVQWSIEDRAAADARPQHYRTKWGHERSKLRYEADRISLIQRGFNHPGRIKFAVTPFLWQRSALLVGQLTRRGQDLRSRRVG